MLYRAKIRYSGLSGASCTGRLKKKKIYKMVPQGNRGIVHKLYALGSKTKRAGYTWMWPNFQNRAVWVVFGILAVSVTFRSFGSIFFFQNVIKLHQGSSGVSCAFGACLVTLLA